MSLICQRLGEEKFEPLSKEEQQSLSYSMRDAKEQIQSLYHGSDFEEFFHDLKRSGAELSFLEDHDVEDEEKIVDFLGSYIEARNRLALSVTRLAVSYVSDCDESLPKDDFLSECMKWAIKCVENFDPDRGHALSTFFMYYAKRAKSDIKEKHEFSYHVPRYLREILYRVDSAREKLKTELSREPSLDEIREEVQESEDRIDRAMNISEKVNLVSKRLTDYDKSDYLGEDALQVSQDMEYSFLRDHVFQFVDRELQSEKERRVFFERCLLEDMTQRELAEELKVSHQRISQIENDIAERFEKWASSRDLEEFVR